MGAATSPASDTKPFAVLRTGERPVNTASIFRPPSFEVFARINNLFDKRYANFGILGSNVFTGPGFGFDPANARSEQFRGYGAPRGAWIGMQYSFE